MGLGGPLRPGSRVTAPTLGRPPPWGASGQGWLPGAAWAWAGGARRSESAASAAALPRKTFSLLLKLCSPSGARARSLARWLAGPASRLPRAASPTGRGPRRGPWPSGGGGGVGWGCWWDAIVPRLGAGRSPPPPRPGDLRRLREPGSRGAGVPSPARPAESGSPRFLFSSAPVLQGAPHPWGPAARSLLILTFGFSQPPALPRSADFTLGFFRSGLRVLSRTWWSPRAGLAK